MSRLTLAVLFSGLFVCVLSAQAAVRPNSKYGGYTLYKDAGGSLMYHEIPVTFDDAKKRCAVEDGVLASPINSGIKAAMMHILLKTNGKKNVFTGFYAEPYNGGVFSSVEGIRLSNIEHTWARDEPNNVDGRENCIMLSPHGIMSDVQCDNRNPYFCFKRDVGDIKHGAAVRPNTTYGVYKEAGGCLMYHEIPVTFDDAKRRCVVEGGVLASPINHGIKAAIMDILLKTNGKKNVFTGFYAEPHNGGVFSSVEGTQLSDVEHTWARDEPNNVDGRENCIMLSPHGIMSDVQCDNRNPYFCFVKEGRVQVCREGYAALDNTTGSCYKLHSNQLGFYEAAKVCEQEGAHLLIINGDNEAQAAASLLVKNNLYLAHIGFQLNVNPRKWMTLQGETIEDAGYAKWHPGGKQDSAPEMSSGLLYINYAEVGFIYFASPSDARRFICEKDAEIVVCE